MSQLLQNFLKTRAEIDKRASAPAETKKTVTSITALPTERKTLKQLISEDADKKTVREWFYAEAERLNATDD